MSNSEKLKYLDGRLAELEFAASNLLFILENEDSAFYQCPIMKANLTKCLTESAAVRRKMIEVKSE